MAGRGRSMVMPSWMKNDSGNGGQVPGTLQQQSAPGGAAATPSNANPPPSDPQAAPMPVIPPHGWAEHKTEDGKTYYFNSMTGASTFIKPQEMMSEIERSLPEVVWKEFIKDGRSYFFNCKTQESVWEEPMEFTTFKERLRALCEGDAPTKDQISMERNRVAREALATCIVNLDGSVPIAKTSTVVTAVKAAPVKKLELKTVSGDLKGASPQVNAYKSKDEAKEAFKQMLNDRNVPPNATWAQAMSKGIANDKRFRALKTLGQRKQALEEYKTWKALIDKDKERMEKKQREENLVKMLDEAKADGRIKGRTRMREALEIFRGDSRFMAYQGSSVKDRDGIVEEYLDKLYAETKKQEEAQREAAESNVRSVLVKLKEDGKLNAKSAVEDCLPLIFSSDEESRKVLDSRSLERLVHGFIRNLEEEEREAQRKKERELKERIGQDTEKYVKWLSEQVKKGTIPLDVKWSHMLTIGSPANQETEDGEGKRKFPAWVNTFDFVRIGDVAEYTTLRDEYPGGSAIAKRKYEDLCEELVPQMTACRRAMRDVFKSAGYSVTPTSTFQQMAQHLDEPAYKAAIGKPEKPTTDVEARPFSLPKFIEASSLFSKYGELYGGSVMLVSFTHLVEQAADDERRALRKLRKKQEHFVDMLGDFIYKTEHMGTTWEMVKPKIEKEKEYIDMSSDELRVPLFQKYMLSFCARKEKKMKSAGEASGAPEPGVSTLEGQPIEGAASKSKEEGEALDDGEIKEERAQLESRARKDREKHRKHSKKKKRKHHRRSRSSSVSSRDRSRNRKAKRTRSTSSGR